MTEEHREGAEEESREEDSSAYPPFPACSPRIPKPLDLGLKLAQLSRGSTLSPALWGCQVQVSEPGPAEGDILPALVGPSPSFSNYLLLFCQALCPSLWSDWEGN